MKIKIYEIALLTGDVTKPLVRVGKASLNDLENYTDLEKNSPEQECSVITRRINQKGDLLSSEIYFGTIKRFLDQEHSKSAMM